MTKVYVFSQYSITQWIFLSSGSKILISYLCLVLCCRRSWRNCSWVPCWRARPPRGRASRGNVCSGEHWTARWSSSPNVESGNSDMLDNNCSFHCRMISLRVVARRKIYDRWIDTQLLCWQNNLWPCADVDRRGQILFYCDWRDPEAQKYKYIIIITSCGVVDLLCL